MRFAHIADSHIGGWRDERMKRLSKESLSFAIDEIIRRRLDFVVIAGDLFDTSIPDIESLRMSVRNLERLKKEGIPVYVIPGSHDFSPSGRSMINVLEEANLLVNVAKGESSEGKLRLSFTRDEKSGALLTGILGRRNSLDREYYERLDYDSLVREDGFKIFVFHAGVIELMPSAFSKMGAVPVSSFPKGFNYYAGGHIHIVKSERIEGYGPFVYPGPLFPNNFEEVERLKEGGFFIFDNGRLERVPIRIKRVETLTINCEGMSSSWVERELKERINSLDLRDAIATIRVKGALSGGSPSDINFREISEEAERKGAYIVLRNTSAFVSREFKEVKVERLSPHEIEEKIVSEHLGTVKVEGVDREKERSLFMALMGVLSEEKGDVKKQDFEDKIAEEGMGVLGVNDK